MEYIIYKYDFIKSNKDNLNLPECLLRKSAVKILF